MISEVEFMESDWKAAWKCSWGRESSHSWPALAASLYENTLSYTHDFIYVYVHI